jgi:PIN domain nuclease of toxin-antitoxin system
MGRVSLVTGNRFLIDTQILIWSFNDPGRLPSRYVDILAGSNDSFVSVATIWEISIKQSIKKIRMPADYLSGLRRSKTAILPISVEHADAVKDLPLHHRDPFDRMIIAQARVEELTILSSDRQFTLYDVSLA